MVLYQVQTWGTPSVPIHLVCFGREYQSGLLCFRGNFHANLAVTNFPLAADTETDTNVYISFLSKYTRNGI